MVLLIRQRLIAQDRQSSYIDQRHNEVSFALEDLTFLKAFLTKGVRFKR